MIIKTFSTATLVFGLAVASSITARGQQTAIATPAAPSTATPSTVWDKVYTDAQATRGKEAYMKECSACHSEDMGGSGYAPALKGDDFAFAWGEKSVGDFFERVRKLMPPDNPGSLSADMYRDIVAYVLHENKYPAGTSELPADPAALKQIKITKQ
jgi:mono/diheme cytochrome c family protein